MIYEEVLWIALGSCGHEKVYNRPNDHKGNLFFMIHHFYERNLITTLRAFNSKIIEMHELIVSLKACLYPFM